MKKLIACVLLMLLAVTTVRAQETAESDNLTETLRPVWVPYLELSLDYASREMLYGEVIDPRQVIMGDFSASWFFDKNFALFGELWVNNVWNDWEKGDNIKNEPDEFDYIFGAYYAIEDVPIAKQLNFVLYHDRIHYPSRSGWKMPGETKNYITLGIETADFDICENLCWHPGVNFTCDYENDEWNISSFGEVKWTICEKLSLTNKAELFWGNARWNAGTAYRYYYIYDEETEDIYQIENPRYKSMLTSFVLGSELGYEVTENIKVVLYGKLVWAVNHTMRDVYKVSDDVHNSSGCDDVFGLRLDFQF